MEFERTGEPPFIKVKSFTDDNNVTISQVGRLFTLNKGEYREVTTFGEDIFSDIGQLTRLLQSSMSSFLRNYNNKIYERFMNPRIVPERGWEGYMGAHNINWDEILSPLHSTGTDNYHTSWFTAYGTEGTSIR